MEILLINPPQIPLQDFNILTALRKGYPAYPPMGLGYLTASLKEHGRTDIELYDCHLEGMLKIMKDYMPKKGSSGLDMMLSTCTVQANLDYSDEEDMISKTLLSAKVQPIITALFANSPISAGKPNGFLSKRRHIWTHTDPDRCGVLKVAFEEDFSFLKYIKYALSVPMYFIRRNNKYIKKS